MADVGRRFTRLASLRLIVIRVKENLHFDRTLCYRFLFLLTRDVLVVALVPYLGTTCLSPQICNLLKNTCLLDGKVGELEPCEDDLVHSVLVGHLGIHLAQLFLLFKGIINLTRAFPLTLGSPLRVQVEMVFHG